MGCSARHIKIIPFFILFVSLLLWVEVRAETTDQPVSITWQHYAYEQQDNYYPVTLTFTLQPGWKLYAPYGDYADSAPKLNWQNNNIISIDPLWPEPEKLDSQTIEAFGYTKNLELPLKVVVKDPTQSAAVHLTVNYVACSAKQCMPLETVIQGRIDPQTKVSAEKRLLAASRHTADIVPHPSKAPPTFNLFTVLIWAFVGGFILNFMPCVLPVLSLKLMTVVRFQGQEKQHIRRGFLWSALGILAAFLALSAVFAVFKAMGTSIGWGFHFQDPYFLIALVLVISFFFFNVLGLWQFKQPQLSGKNTSKAGWGRDFAEGVLVMVLATPCTAPFVGAAVGVALGQSWPFMTMILMTLALGLASPYLLVALFPKVIAFLPRPGTWMQKIKWLMGLGLGLTILWLLYVLRTHIGFEGVLLVIGLLTAIAILLWQRKKIPSQLIRAGSVSLLSLMLFFTPLWHKTSSPLIVSQVDKNKVPLPTSPSSSAIHKRGEWLPFDPNMIEKLVADNKIVFVDVTADWCLLCQVNKKTVISDPKLQKYFDEGKIVPMRADWTNRDDPRVIEYLQSFQRYGIPMNVIYGPGAKEGILLSEWLTLEEIERAYQEALKR